MSKKSKKHDNTPQHLLTRSEDLDAFPSLVASLKEPATWTVAETAGWLDSIELPELKRLFIDQQISGSELLELTDSDLREMGVDKLGHRKKLIKRIAMLKGDIVSTSESGNHAMDSITGSEDSFSTSSNAQRPITLRCHFKDDVANMKYSQDMTFKSLRRDLKKRFGTDLRLKFKDYDGELISIKREADLVECIKEAQFAGHSRVKIYLTAKDSGSAAKEKATSQQARTDMFEFFDCILDPVIIISELGIIQYVNSKMEGVLGYTPAELQGKNVSMITPEDIRPYHDSFLRNYLKTGISRIIGKGRDVLAVTKDGTLIPIHLEVSEKQLANGKMYYIGIFKPVKSQAASKSLLQQEREVLDTLIVPAVIIDQTGVIHGFNKACSDFLGYSLIDVVGKNVSMLMPAPHCDLHDTYLKNYLTTGVAKIIGIGRKVVAQAKDGSLFPVYLTVTEKKDKDKKFFTGILQAIKN